MTDHHDDDNNDGDGDTRARVEAMFRHLQGLRTDMDATLRELRKDISDYEHVAAQGTQKQTTQLCHLGHGVHVQAVVPDAAHGVHLHVGLGFFVELPWPQAVDVAQARVAVLQGRAALTEATIAGLDADLLEVLANNGLDASALHGGGDG